MSWRLRLSMMIGAMTFLLAAVIPVLADDTQSLDVTVTTESIAITISQDTLAFAGPHEPGALLSAHPSATGIVPPPSITNSGNVALTGLFVSYTGPTGQEATCGNGGTWAAHQSTQGPDQFAIRVLASSASAFSTFNSGASYIHPTNGSANILGASLAPAASIPLLLQLRMPNPPVNGTGGCSIGLAVTAAAGS
jgi:hypothetical protein